MNHLIQNGNQELALTQRFGEALKLARQDNANADGQIRTTFLNLFEEIFNQIKEVFKQIAVVVVRMTTLEGQFTESEKINQINANQSNERFDELMKRMDALKKEVILVKEENVKLATDLKILQDKYTTHDHTVSVPTFDTRIFTSGGWTLKTTATSKP
jgi:hypothetical protein